MQVEYMKIKRYVVTLSTGWAVAAVRAPRARQVLLAVGSLGGSSGLIESLAAIFGVATTCAILARPSPVTVTACDSDSDVWLTAVTLTAVTLTAPAVRSVVGVRLTVSSSHYHSAIDRLEVSWLRSNYEWTRGG
ncbi:hypothetical protein ACJJTC_002857 [Scirpophaga incertulas]